MLTSTTHHIDGQKIKSYLGIVAGEIIMGANILRDMVASITDIVGGRSGVYENKVIQAREAALKEMVEEARKKGANGVIGIAFSYQTVGKSMLMVSLTGTAVILEQPF
jgi:uncharacterized protein YbjQ (UPF0145 family)